MPVLENLQQRPFTRIANRSVARKGAGPVVAGRRGTFVWTKMRDRMSAITACYRILGILVIFSLGTLLAGCSGYTGDQGAKRTQHQSEELRARINTTQIDR